MPKWLLTSEGHKIFEWEASSKRAHVRPRKHRMAFVE